MTLTEDLLQQIVDGYAVTTSNQAQIISILMGWGKPNGIAGPRDRMPVQVHFDEVNDPSKTQQSFKDECNINNIMAKYRKTGEMTHLATREPTYGDFTTGLDFQDAQNAVIAAQADFDSLSAAIRSRMDNNPATLLAFMNDPENLEEARELGLVNPAPPAEPGPEDSGATASGEPVPPQPTPIAGGE